MFHDCRVKDDGLHESAFYNRDKSMNILKCKLDEYYGEGWRMFALMKKVIADNNFDFKKRMAEIYND